MGQIWTGDTSPKHKKSDRELALEELAKPLGPEVTVAEWLVCQVKWSLFLGVTAALWGIGLNMRTYSEFAGYSDATSSTPLPASFIELIMVSLAFAAPAIMVKCALRCYTHRYWYQAASFAVYVTLLAMLHYEVDTYHPSLHATGYRFHSKASQLLYTAPFEDVTGRSFESISTSRDFYTWMKGPLRNFIFTPTKLADSGNVAYNTVDYDLPMFDASSTHKVANWKIFAVEVRQLRVEPNTCPDYQDTMGQLMIGSGFQCMGPYNKGDESTTPRTSTFSGETYAPTSYKNWVGDEVDVGSVSGRFNLYPCNSGIRSKDIDSSSSGYLFQFGNTPIIADYDSLATAFETSGWVDALTRYVEVSITVANLNTNLRSTINLFIEADEAGNFQSGPFKVNNLLLSYDHPIALPTLVCLFVFMGELCENVLLPRVRGRGSKGLLADDAVFNILDIAIIVTLVWFKAMDWEAMRLLPGDSTQGTTASMRYATGTSSVMVESSLYLFGTSICFMIIKSFSFLRGVPSLERIGSTASGVVFKVGVLISALGVVCYALGSMLHMLFKSNVHGFSGVGSSMVSIIRLFLGDFDTLENVLMAGPVYGFGAGFMAIVALVFYISIAFIVVATFLTILAESHAEAEQPNEIEPESVITYGAHVTYGTAEEIVSKGMIGMTDGFQACIDECRCCDKVMCPETVCCGIICCGNADKGGEMVHIESVGTPSIDDLSMVISTNFDKYDIDQSGTINTVMEMTQLVTMLFIKLSIPSNPTQVQKVISSMGQLEDHDGNLNWTKDKFTNWFQHEFLDCWVNDVQSQSDGSGTNRSIQSPETHRSLQPPGTHRSLQSQEIQPSDPIGVDVDASREDVPALLMELDTLGDEAPVEAQNAT